MKNIKLKRRWIFLSGLLLAILNTPIATWAVESDSAQKLWGGLGQVFYLADWVAIYNSVLALKSPCQNLATRLADREDKTPMRQIVNQVQSMLSDFDAGVVQKLEGLCKKVEVFGVNDPMYKGHKAALDAAVTLYQKIGAVVARANYLLENNALPIQVQKRKGRVNNIVKKPLNGTTFLIGMQHELVDLASVESIQSIRKNLATAKEAFTHVVQGDAQGVIPAILALFNMSSNDSIVQQILDVIANIDHELDVFEHTPLTKAAKANLVLVVSPHIR